MVFCLANTRSEKTNPGETKQPHTRALARPDHAPPLMDRRPHPLHSAQIPRPPVQEPGGAACPSRRRRRSWSCGSRCARHQLEARASGASRVQPSRPRRTVADVEPAVTRQGVLGRKLLQDQGSQRQAPNPPEGNRERAGPTHRHLRCGLRPNRARPPPRARAAPRRIHPFWRRVCSRAEFGVEKSFMVEGKSATEFSSVLEQAMKA